MGQRTPKSQKITKPTLGVRVTEEMYQALTEISNRTGIPIAELVRQALEHKLAEYGYECESSISWGGYRKSANET